MQLGSLLRSVTAFRGKLRLANALINRGQKDIRINTRSGRFLLPTILDNQYFELYVNGIYEKKLVDYILESVPNNGTFIDIGANIGSISIPVALARPDISIIAIEALPLNYRYLTENLKLNGITTVKALNICCSDVPGKTVRFYCGDIANGNSSFHSLHTNNYLELTTSTVDQQLAEMQIQKVDLVKIDTEGSEGLIFKGGVNMLKNATPNVLFEVVANYEQAIADLYPGASQEILKDLGYCLYDFNEYPRVVPIKEIIRHGGRELLASIRSISE